MKKIKIALIRKVLIACVLGCFLGRIFPVPAIRIYALLMNIVLLSYVAVIARS